MELLWTFWIEAVHMIRETILMPDKNFFELQSRVAGGEKTKTGL